MVMCCIFIAHEGRGEWTHTILDKVYLDIEMSVSVYQQPFATLADS